MRSALVSSMLIVSLAGCGASHVSDADAGRLDASTADDGAVGADGAFGIPPCTVASDCTLLPESCCGFCGVPTADDMIAVPDDRVDEHVTMACAGGVACPDCAGRPDPFLLAICETGRCQALDLHTDERTLCEGDADCQLAAATCCACGLLGPSEVVAYNPARGSYAELVCDPRAECPPCVPAFDGLEPGCDAGRCVVRVLMP